MGRGRWRLKTGSACWSDSIASSGGATLGGQGSIELFQGAMARARVRGRTSACLRPRGREATRKEHATGTFLFFAKEGVGKREV